jgi:hypothetical protein
MEEYNREKQLKQLHENRKVKTKQKVDEAIKRLIKANKSINFNSISNESTVSKATLYNNLDIKKRIENLRMQQSKVNHPSQIKRNMNENSKDAVIVSLKRKLKKLEQENKELHEKLKFSYAEVYKKI